MTEKDQNTPVPDAPGAGRGVEVIRAFVKTLPATPGVYRMLDEKGGALYIGKAKNLKKRVTAYTQPEKHSIRIQRMIALTVQMDCTTTETEAEALLLEANQIKRLKPRYNILLRDDKSFPYIRISDHDYPLLAKHRGARSDGGDYFGPFASGLAVNETLNILQRAFLLRNCSDAVFSLRTRPCLQYQIKRCTAPCVGKVTARDYAAQVDLARRFLRGKSREVQDKLAKNMQAASDRMDYESAAAYRDRIRALTQIQAQQRIHVQGVQDTDVHVLHQEAGQSCIQVFFFRGGQNFGNRAYFPRHSSEDAPSAVLAAFIAQFYANKPAPGQLIVSHIPEAKDVIEEALTLRSGHKVSLVQPQRGPKKDLLAMADDNAREALARRLADRASQQELFEKLAAAFHLEATPERVEVYDNSHISGRHALGAMIVATPDGFAKNAYRRYNMPADKAGDDFAMMRHMLTRRFHALAREDSETARPDLLLIDGGQGQLSAVLSVLADMGVSDIPVVAIAKGPDRNAGRERFFMPGRPAFSLPPRDPALYFVQRLRDEAHRFAISSHRNSRSRAIGKSPLDQVPGIGAGRKKALLLHFGSAKAVAEAGLADLQKVEGISRAVAQKIYDFFHADS